MPFACHIQCGIGSSSDWPTRAARASPWATRAGTPTWMPGSVTRGSRCRGSTVPRWSPSRPGCGCQRAIAKVLGVGVATLHWELTRSFPSGPSDPADGGAIAGVIGRDGKEYPRTRRTKLPAAPCSTSGEHTRNRPVIVRGTCSRKGWRRIRTADPFRSRVPATRPPTARRYGPMCRWVDTSGTTPLRLRSSRRPIPDSPKRPSDETVSRL